MEVGWSVASETASDSSLNHRAHPPAPPNFRHERTQQRALLPSDRRDCLNHRAHTLLVDAPHSPRHPVLPRSGLPALRPPVRRLRQHGLCRRVQPVRACVH